MESPESTDTRPLHEQAKKTYTAFAEATGATRVWDELKTYEHVAWREVVRAVNAELEKDLQYAVYEFGHEHWHNCDLTAEDCYLCAGYENLRDKYPNKG